MAQTYEYQYLQKHILHTINNQNNSDNQVIIEKNDSSLRINLYAPNPVTIQSFWIDLPEEIPAQVYCNGFQSWSVTEWVNPFQKQKCLHPWVRSFLSGYGDYSFWYKIAQNKKHVHSSWLTIVPHSEHYTLYYPKQTQAYLLFEYGFKDKIRLHVELEGKKIEGKYLLLDLAIRKIKKMEEIPLLLNPERQEKQSLTGWCSWYYHYTNISDTLIINRLHSFSNTPADVIQIDDGWQKKTGDWTPNEKFNLGMKNIVDSIHAQGKKAGIWIAPFIVSKGSDLYKNKPEWLQKDEYGKLVLAGINPIWGGWKNRKFYALDLQNIEVQEHIKKIIYTITKDWGFDLIKADFLYAGGLLPNGGFSRSENMKQAMALLKNEMGSAQLLGCGVPLEAALGYVDYCRIGQDMGLKWEHKWMNTAHSREQLSCHLSVRNSLNRWILGSDLLGNDPDVFFLRNTHCKLSESQKNIIYQINHLTGKLIFTSDNPIEWTENQKIKYDKIFPQTHTRLLDLTYDKNIFEVLCSNEDKKYRIWFNLGKKRQEIILPDTLWDGEQLRIAPKGEKIILKPMNSRIFRCFPEHSDVVWADGKWLGGSDLSQGEVEGQNIEFQWRGYYPLQTLWVRDVQSQIQTVTGMPVRYIQSGNYKIVSAPFGWK